MTSVRRKSPLVLLAAPLLWLVPAMLHPVGDPYAGIAGEIDSWLFVHLAQLALCRSSEHSSGCCWRASSPPLPGSPARR